jgi:hypothetical protein
LTGHVKERDASTAVANGPALLDAEMVEEAKHVTG